MTMVQSVFVPSAGLRTPEMQTIAGTVASHSNQKGELQMSESSEQERGIEDLDNADANDLTKYHKRKIRRRAESASESDSFYLTASETQRSGAVLGLFLLGTLVGALIAPFDPVFPLVCGLAVGGIGFLTFTRSGVAMRRTFNDLQSDDQQQQQSSYASSEPKRICSNCGWQNPKANSYCHDCGEELQGK